MTALLLRAAVFGRIGRSLPEVLLLAVIVTLAVIATLMVQRFMPHVPRAGTCASYGSQAAAQSAYRSDPVRLMQLDADRDGIACENNRVPRDVTPVAR